MSTIALKLISFFNAWKEEPRCRRFINSVQQRGRRYHVQWQPVRYRTGYTRDSSATAASISMCGISPAQHAGLPAASISMIVNSTRGLAAPLGAGVAVQMLGHMYTEATAEAMH